MKLIVGLGNPGKEYDNTRHNVGFKVLDYYSKDGWKSKFSSLIKEENIYSEKVIFCKPQIFMNNSGLAVKQIVDFYHLEIKDILIIQDDLDEEVGHYKLKQNSSSGGHNGINSIIDNLNSTEFFRLKIGISNDKKRLTKDYVLSKFNPEETEIIQNLLPKFKEIIISYIEKGIEKTMNNYNKK